MTSLTTQRKVEMDFYGCHRISIIVGVHDTNNKLGVENFYNFSKCEKLVGTLSCTLYIVHGHSEIKNNINCIHSRESAISKTAV